MPESKDMMKDVIKRLKSFGVLFNDLEDCWLMKFIIQKVVNHITSNCNVDCIPCELYEKAVYMICGEFLYEKRAQGKLNLDDFDLNGMVSSIKLGDAHVNFSSEIMSDIQRLDFFIDFLKNSMDVSDYIAFRRMKW